MSKCKSKKENHEVNLPSCAAELIIKKAQKFISWHLYLP
ncbi:hypothetical protein NARC_140010 [Candidatus Nitrosocosmicus arcticus]|uniref:Uncharacterized protein n=1 Tax=Candidatus Nitrosocosmicus arcticus TaxID=2035267 RepID=A0A557SSI2_9ARCH|nr:hypothetical protein NARC_140010 [Candidatus Nitrosocosmicus arcticus]